MDWLSSVLPAFSCSARFNVVSRRPLESFAEGICGWNSIGSGQFATTAQHTIQNIRCHAHSSSCEESKTLRGQTGGKRKTKSRTPCVYRIDGSSAIFGEKY